MLKYADTGEEIFATAGMDYAAIPNMAEKIAIYTERVVEVLDKCQHCGKMGAETIYVDSVLGCEYEVHIACKKAFAIDTERETGHYFYGE